MTRRRHFSAAAAALGLSLAWFPDRAGCIADDLRGDRAGTGRLRRITG